MSTENDIAHDRLPQDPLAALGSSIFVTILSSLPHTTLTTVPQISKAWHRHSLENKSGVWRDACYRTGVSDRLMRRLMSSESSPIDLGPDHPMAEPQVDWKTVCKDFVAADKNWQEGTCNEGWIYDDDDRNGVWKFKIDPELDTCIMTRMHGGIVVVDRQTSEPLFNIPHARPYAHLEFCKGYAIFDVELDTGGSGLQVHRTQAAISRSKHPWPSVNALPPVADSAFSRMDTDWKPSSMILRESPSSEEFKQSPPFLPDGGLAFYRQVTPPTPCHAFRARLDGEGTKDERVILGTAGQEAVYLWDVEDENQEPEVITFPEAVEITYIEFDDDNVFICSKTKLEIYSRQTKNRILSFPPAQGTMRSFCSVAYYLECTDYGPESGAIQILRHGPGDHYGVNLRPELNLDQPTRALIGRADVPGARSDETDISDTLQMTSDSGIGRRRGDYEWPMEIYEFSACHYNDKDLFCTTTYGHLIIIRNYATILAINDPEERAKQLGEQTLVIGFRLPVRQLAVDETHVTIVTQNHVIFFDTRTLPNLPLDPLPYDIPEETMDTSDPEYDMPGGQPYDGPKIGGPSIRLHMIMSVSAGGVGTIGCAQISGSGMYYSYSAILDENTADHPRDPRWIARPPAMPMIIPERAKRSLARCVRAYNFA